MLALLLKNAGSVRNVNVSTIRGFMAEGLAAGILNDYCYNAAIGAFTKSGSMDLAEESFRSMVSAGLKPSIHTYVPLVRGYLQKGQPAAAFSVIKGMKEHGVLPDLPLFNKL